MSDSVDRQKMLEYLKKLLNDVLAFNTSDEYFVGQANILAEIITEVEGDNLLKREWED